MLGMNKNKKDKEPNPFFSFPLEEDIKNNENMEMLLKNAESKISALKKTIREGASPEEYENLGILLHGYSALVKILTGAPKKIK